MSDPHFIHAVAVSPVGASYRGKVGCRNVLCTSKGDPDACYGWHCLYCDGPSNCQGDCWNRECPGKQGTDSTAAGPRGQGS